MCALACVLTTLAGGAPGQLDAAVPDPDEPARPPVYQSNQLIVLLVIVPLAVGASAVCLVFLNYHCKMC